MYLLKVQSYFLKLLRRSRDTSKYSKHTSVCPPSVMCIRHIRKEAASDTRGQVSLFCAEPPFSVQTKRADISCVFSLGAKFIIVSQRVLNSTG